MRELLKYIDKEVTINLIGLRILVTVKDVKQSYGKTRFLVTPVAGGGESWIENISMVREVL